MRKPRHRYTPEEIRFLESNIAGRSYAELAEMFNRKFNLSMTTMLLKTILYYYGLKNGRPGNVFYSGHTRSRHPVGSECIDKSNGYTMVKIAAPSVWKAKHKMIWEEANGPIPEGHVILFADGNKSNFDLKNLLLISRRERMVMNSKHLIFPDAELTKCGLLMAKIILQTKDYERRGKEGGLKNEHWH
jgi:hypothetical protein